MKNSRQFLSPKVVLLDVYETLLDMSEVESGVNLLLNSKRGYIIWFELFMEYCFVDNCTAQFNDFPSIAKASLLMAAKKLRTAINEQDANSILILLEHVPIKSDVQNALSKLNDSDFRIAALTNASEKTVRTRMERTGLISYFETVLSAENVGKYKPSLEVYDWAARKLEVKPSEILMVSTHSWDIAGAANAGMHTAYLKREDEIFFPLGPSPTIELESLLELSNTL